MKKIKKINIIRFFILIELLSVLVLFSGSESESLDRSDIVNVSYNGIQIVGAVDNNERQIITDAINNTDINITRYITQIYVVNSTDGICGIVGLRSGYVATGCVNIKYKNVSDYNNQEILDVEITVLSLYNRITNSLCEFKFTIYHEIGHIDEVYKGLMIEDYDEGELYADNYALNYTKRCRPII